MCVFMHLNQIRVKSVCGGVSTLADQLFVVVELSILFVPWASPAFLGGGGGGGARIGQGGTILQP